MRPEKQYLVKELSDKINDASGFFVTAYIGLTAETINELRIKCAQESAKYMIVKNRIFKIALKKSGIELDDNIDQTLKESTAIAFSKENAVAVAKTLVSFGKDNGLPKVKAGYIYGKWFDAEQVVEFSKLPSKEVLLARLMGTLKSPLNGVAGILAGAMRNFVYALKAVGEKKES